MDKMVILIASVRFGSKQKDNIHNSTGMLLAYSVLWFQRRTQLALAAMAAAASILKPTSINFPDK